MRESGSMLGTVMEDQSTLASSLSHVSYSVSLFIAHIHNTYVQYVEPLYYGYHWDSCNCPDCRGVLNSGVVLYRIATIGTKPSVHI